MLKLVHVADVNRLVFNRDAAIGRSRCLQHNDFQILINGEVYDNADVRQEVKAVLERHLHGRVGKLNRQLLALGVDVQD